MFASHFNVLQYFPLAKDEGLLSKMCIWSIKIVYRSKYMKAHLWERTFNSELEDGFNHYLTFSKLKHIICPLLEKSSIRFSEFLKCYILKIYFLLALLATGTLLFCLASFVHMNRIKVTHGNGYRTINTFCYSGGEFFKYYYIKPWCRMGPYIVGILTGYLLYKLKGRIKIPTVCSQFYHNLILL